MNWNPIKENWQYRAIALFLAVFSWYLVSGREKVETWIELPVELFNLPEDQIIRSGLVNKIEVRIRGTKGSVRSVKERKLAYTVDMSGLKKGENQIVFTPGNIPLPGAVEVIEIMPARIQVEVDRRVSKQLPVKISWQGQIDPDYELVNELSQPETVRLLGPERILQNMSFVSTRTFDIEVDDSGAWQSNVPLDIPPELEADPPQVQVRLSFKPKTRDIWVKLPVEVKVPKNLNVELQAPEVRVHMDLPVTLFQKPTWREELSVQLTITPDTKPGDYELVPRITVPRWGEILETRPEKVNVTVTKK
ncbi:MAG: YbbR-like domain-containing protein [Desulfovibrionales bacterium]